MSPSLSSIIRLTSRIAVVLPQPDGPTSTQTSPAGTVKLRSPIAGASCPGYRLDTLTNSTVAAGVRDPPDMPDGPSAWAVCSIGTRSGGPGGGPGAPGGTG